MANQTIANLVAQVNDTQINPMPDLPLLMSNDIQIDFLNNQTPAVSSLEVARHFQKKHKNVLRDIQQIMSISPKSFNGLNFEPVEYTDNKGEKRPHYLLTRDAFSLLVMGFTGTAAIRWKLKYIEAFNALEQGALGHQLELAREAGYREGQDYAKSLPALEVECKTAYLEGLKEGKKLYKKDNLQILCKAKAYLGKGLAQGEAAKLLGISNQKLGAWLRKIRLAGF